MRVLIDACLPINLLKHVPIPGTATVREMGWQHLKNGALLARAQSDFDVLTTLDKSIPSQQHLTRYSIGLVIVRARSNRLSALLPLLPRILASLAGATPGRAVVVEG